MNSIPHRKRLLWAVVFFTALFGIWIFSKDSKAEQETEFSRQLSVLMAQDSAEFATYQKLLGFSVDTTYNTGLLNYVIDWLGTPYRRAGLSKFGVDCSGFVLSVYKEVFGIDLVHSSAAMVRQMHEFVRKQDLMPGDILFFRINGKTISHVGIYLSNNKFVHASTRSGVVIDDLNEAYYKRTFYKAGRILSSVMTAGTSH